MIKIEYLIPLLTLFIGYYLGKKEWKKQFNLRHFDLHEKILNCIENIINDELGKYYFTLSNKDINKKIKNHFILSDSEYFKKLKEKNIFLPNDYFPPLMIYEDVVSLIKELRKLSSRSNKKISKIAKNIINIYDNGTNDLNFEIELLADYYNYDVDNKISEEQKKYIEYLSHESKEVILLKIIGLIKNLKGALNDFLKNKE